MAFAYPHPLAARLAGAAALLALAYPACAAISPTDSASAAASVSAEADQEPPPQAPRSVEWLVQPDAQSLQRDISYDDNALLQSLVQAMAVADWNQYLLHGAGRKEDRDLSAADAAAIVGDRPSDDEPLLSQYWWQAIPGVMTTLVAGWLLYMRKPLQRKRKYRRTPHEPSGPYKRRGGGSGL